MALSGNSALIGAPDDDTAGAINAGSAYIFTRTGTSWKRQSKLQVASGFYDRFGSSVALDGDTALIGGADLDAPNLQNTGAVYVFSRSGTVWKEQASLLSSDREESDGFGKSIAVRGSIALIGAPYNQTVGRQHKGSAYIFQRNGAAWGEKAKLLPLDPMNVEYFAVSVALTENTALIGAQGDFFVPGSVYVYTRDGTNWIEQVRLRPPNSSPNDAFGRSVALDGDTALVGCMSGRLGVGSTSSAQVFVRKSTVWVHEAELLPDSDSPSGVFGHSVALSGGIALIGAPFDTNQIQAQGSTYVFTRRGTKWLRQAKIWADISRPDDYFGSSVALDGDTALIGAYGADTALATGVDISYDQGSVYVYRLRYEAGPPDGGIMTISPGLRVDGAAEIIITFENWTGDALPLNYEVVVDGTIVSSAGSASSRIITAPSTAGSHVLVGRIYDSLNRLTELTHSFDVNTVLESWRQSFFGTTANADEAADSADPDADGVTNLLEWARRSNPIAPDVMEPLLMRSGSILEFNYSRNVQAVNAGGIFRVEWSDTLDTNSWFSTDVREETVLDNGVVQHVRATLPAGEQATRYVRLHFTAPP